MRTTPNKGQIFGCRRDESSAVSFITACCRMGTMGDDVYLIQAHLDVVGFVRERLPSRLRIILMKILNGDGYVFA